MLLVSRFILAILFNICKDKTNNLKTYRFASKLLSLSLITYHFFCVHLQNKRNFKNRENPGYGKLYCIGP